MRDEFARSVVPLPHIALIDRIGCPTGRHLHVLFPEDELTASSIECEDIDAGAGAIHELRGRAVQDVSRDELLTSRNEDVVDTGPVSGRASLDREDGAERTVYVGIR